MAGDEWEVRYHIFLERMESRFPEMYQGNYGGFLIGEGWWSLVEDLSEVLHDHSKSIAVDSVKTVNGGLVFLAKNTDGYSLGAIDFARKLSYNMCEECGKPAEPADCGGYVRTLCKSHCKMHGCKDDKMDSDS